MTTFLFVRHAETRANAVGRLEGWTDRPLTAAGRRQSEALATRLRPEKESISALYSSPLRRAYQTAQILGEHLHLKPKLNADLREIHFGDVEGLTLAEMEEQFPDLFVQWRDKRELSFRWPDGERRADFFKRATAGCTRIQRLHAEEKVVVVSHGGTIRACLAHLLPDELGRWWAYGLDNSGLTRVHTAEDGNQLLTLNDISHLEVVQGSR